MTTIANIKVMMRTKPGGQNHILYSRRRTDVVDVVTHVVNEEVTEVGEEFRQHDGVVTILMYYRRGASPKHRYNIIEDYGGGGHRTRPRDQEINCCVSKGCPLPVYKGMEEGEGRPSLWRTLGESYSHRE